MTFLHTLDDLDAAVRRSDEQPIVIFKHSETCGLSAMARREVEDFVTDNPSVEVLLVPVQSAARVSRAIAERFGVQHESPQVLVVRDGVVVWHASHVHVNRQEITAALDAARDQRH